MNNLLVFYNDQDLADFLARRIMIRRLKHKKIKWNATNAYVDEHKKIYKKSRVLKIDGAHLAKLIEADVSDFQKHISQIYKDNFRNLQRFITERIPNLSPQELQQLVDWIGKEASNSLIEKTALTLADTITIASRHQGYSPVQVSLVRNVLNNEEYLRDKMMRRNSFYFIDSGYTNFLGRHKRWHRLVKNNLHPVPDLSHYWPTDRLLNFETMPQKWHRGGSRILIVESSDHHHLLHDSNRSQWRKNVSAVLAHYTNKEIYFKEKDGDRKNRVSVWDMLQDDPKSWYCVITDASAAAIEAVWMGVPIITLKPHVTMPISAPSLEHINDLNYCNIGNWLCALSYSQFTYDEMINGTAARIMDKYHYV